MFSDNSGSSSGERRGLCGAFGILSFAVSWRSVIVNVVLVDLYYDIPAGATVMALSLLGGDLVLLIADRHRLRFDQRRCSLCGLSMMITLRLDYVTGQTSAVMNDESKGQLRLRTKQ